MQHRMSRLRRHAVSTVIGSSFLTIAAPASAEVDFAPIVVIDFSTFDGSGFAPDPAPGQLDSNDWSVRLGEGIIVPFGGSGPGGGHYGLGTSAGGVDDAGIWAFDVDGAGLIALGVQPSTTYFTPGQIVLRVVNNTGDDVEAFQIEYTVWVNNASDRSNFLHFEESSDDITYFQVGGAVLSPELHDKNGFTSTDQVHVVTPASPVLDGSHHFLAWAGDDVSGDGSRDEFGIEGITIRLLDVCGNGLIETGETCDDGLDNANGAACLTDCVAAACGDGAVHVGVEECDDGNVADGDGCAATCTIEGGTSTAADTGDSDDTTAANDTGTSNSASGSDGTATSSTPQTGTGNLETDTDAPTAAEYEPAEWEYGCDCSHRRGSSGALMLVGLFALAVGRSRNRRERG